MKTSLENNHAVVFGGDGVIASWVIEALNDLSITPIPISKNPKSINDKYYANITSYDQVYQVYDYIFDEFKSIDSIYCCSGVLDTDLIYESDPVRWSNVINTNLVGAYNIYRAFNRLENIDQYIKFVFLGSTACIGRPIKKSSYSISKLAIEQLVNYINNEYPYNYRACCLRLGTCRTNFSGEKLPNDALTGKEVGALVKVLESYDIKSFPDFISSRPILNKVDYS